MSWVKGEQTTESANQGSCAFFDTMVVIFLDGILGKSIKPKGAEVYSEHGDDE